MVKSVITLLLALCLVLPIVSSQGVGNTFVTSPNNLGTEIAYRPIEVLKQGEDYRIHLHLFNSTSTGLKVLTNTTSSCFYHLYNSTGFDIDAGTLEWEAYNNIDFAQTILGGNFSQVGFYTIILQCNTTGNIASYVTGSFHVSPDGVVYDFQDIVTPFGLMFLSMVLVALSFLFSSRYWLIKSFFIFLALGLGLLAVNAAKLISGHSVDVGTMAGVGVTISVILLVFYVTYLLIFATIEIINVFKRKGDIKWNSDEFKE